jgi:hypothetical protein
VGRPQRGCGRLTSPSSPPPAGWAPPAPRSPRWRRTQRWPAALAAPSPPPPLGTPPTPARAAAACRGCTLVGRPAEAPGARGTTGAPGLGGGQPRMEAGWLLGRRRRRRHRRRRRRRRRRRPMRSRPRSGCCSGSEEPAGRRGARSRCALIQPFWRFVEAPCSAVAVHGASMGCRVGGGFCRRGRSPRTPWRASGRPDGRRRRVKSARY